MVIEGIFDEVSKVLSETDIHSAKAAATTTNHSVVGYF